MLQAAVYLRDAIGCYFNKWIEADCAGDELSLEDWIILEKIRSFLEKLEMTAKALESSFATVGSTRHDITYLIDRQYDSRFSN